MSKLCSCSCILPVILVYYNASPSAVCAVDVSGMFLDQYARLRGIADVEIGGCASVADRYDDVRSSGLSYRLDGDYTDR